jgi:hypothetical protein
LREEVLGGVVGETKIARKKLLVENGSAKETGELLFFRGIAGESEGMTNTREDEAGDATLERLKKSKFSIREVKGNVGLMNFDAIFGGDEVDGLRVEAKGVKREKRIAGGVCGGYEWKQGQEKNEDGAKPHEGV